MSTTSVPPGPVAPTQPSPGRAIGMMFLPALLLYLLIAGYVVARGGAVMEANLRAILPYLIIANHTLVFIALLVLLRREGRSLRSIGWRLPAARGGAWRELALGVGAALLLYLFKELVFDSLMALLAGDPPTFTTLFHFRVVAAEVPFLLVAGVFPFVEESVYRGYGLPPLLERWGVARALLVMAALFGLLHLGNGAVAFLYSGVLGVGFAGLYLWRRTLLTGVVAHGLYNVLIVLT